MKRKNFLFAYLLIFLLCLFGCSITVENVEVEKDYSVTQANVYEQTKKVVEELNKNSNLYMDMLSFVDQHEWMGYITPECIRQVLRDQPPRGGFGIWDESNEVNLARGLFDLFPLDTDDIRLTQLTWIVPDSFHVFGIDVGSDIEEAKAILLQRGFEEQEPHPHFQCEAYINRHNRRMRIFGNNLVGVSFFVVADGSEILEVRVSVTDPFRGQPTIEEGVEGVDWLNNKVAMTKFESLVLH